MSNWDAYGKFRQGERAMPLTSAQAYEKYRAGERALNTPALGSSNPTLTSNKVESVDPISSLLEQLQQKAPQFQRRAFVGPPPTSKLTAAQRAAGAVDPLYNSRSNAIARQQSRLLQDLNLGVATQNEYAKIGDAKLKDIYDKLTSVAQGNADKIKQTYDVANSQIAGTYDAAQSTLASSAKALQGDVNSEAASLGLQAAVPAATGDLTDTASALNSQTGADRANSISNIITLGANMGAAALQDVTNIATLGANVRKDLVNNVQSTLAELQRSYNSASQELSAQLSDLEAERAAALQQATSQYEADDIDRQYKYEMAKLQFETEQDQQELAFYQNNLDNLFKALQFEQNKSNDKVSQDLAKASIELQRSQQAFNQGMTTKEFEQSELRRKFEEELAMGNQLIDYQKMGQAAKQAAFDNWAKARGLELESGRLSVSQEQLKLDAAAKAQEIYNRGQTLIEQSLKNQKAVEELKQLREKAKADIAKYGSGMEAAAKYLADTNNYDLLGRVQKAYSYAASQLDTVSKVGGTTDIVALAISGMAGNNIPGLGSIAIGSKEYTALVTALQIIAGKATPSG